MRSTPHRRTTATAALVVAAAVLAVAVPGAPAMARGDGGEGTARPAAAKPDRGALPAQLTPAQRAALVQKAEKATDKTADRLDLGGQEELRVRDVVKDADGTVHTRYERTYAGLPVLGGDLVVHAAKSGAVESVTRAYKPELKVSDLSAEVSKAAAEKQALAAAKEEGSAKTEADSSRKVVWAAKGTPTLAYETVVSGFQHDDTPSELHVITDAQTGKKLYEYEAVHTGTGNTRYSGTVTLGTSQSGSSYTLTDADRGNHRTYNLNRGSSGTGTLFSGTDDVWGDGTTANLETAGADAHYGAALTWDYYKNVHGRNGLRNDGVAPYSRVHYGNNYVNAFWQDTCFCMTYGDGSGNANPLTSIDVAAHEMTHGLTSVTANLVYSGESGGLNEATSDIFAAAVEFAAEQQRGRRGLPGRREDRHQRRRHTAALHGQAQQGRLLARLLVLHARQHRRPLLLGPGQPLVLPGLRGQRREGRQRRLLRLTDLRRTAGDGDRSRGRREDLVPGAHHVHDVHDQLRRRPYPHPAGRRRPVRARFGHLQQHRQRLGRDQRRLPDPRRCDGRSMRPLSTP